MKILFLTIAWHSGNGFAGIMSRQFLREGHRVETLEADHKKESRIKALKQCGEYDLAFLPGTLLAGLPEWRLKLVLWRLRHRRVNLVVDITDSRGCDGRLPDILYSVKGVTLITSKIEDVAEVGSRVASGVEYVGIPVDMALHDLRRPDFRHTDGKLAIMVADESFASALSEIVSRYSRDMILFRASGCDKVRREKIYRLSHVVVCGRGTGTPGELVLRAMADGKVALGVGGEAYHCQIGEPQAVFYPEIENPGPSDTLLGPDIAIEGGEECGDSGGSQAMFISELERVLALLCDPALLRDIGLAGREQVRRHHSSEIISSAIMKIVQNRQG